MNREPITSMAWELLKLVFCLIVFPAIVVVGAVMLTGAPL